MADDVQYEFMAVKAIRGREAKRIAEWENRGWELVDQGQGTLQTTLNFRRPKPETFLTKVWASFRSLNPKTQLRLVAAAAGLIMCLAVIGGIASLVGGGDGSTDAESTKSPTQTVAVKSEKPSATPEPSQSATPEPSQSATPEPSQSATPEPSQSATPEPSQSATPAETYAYRGPRYEIVTVDEDVSNAHLDQYWVYTNEFDYSTDAFRKQVKMIIADIAHREKTAKLIVQVVTDKEIIEAESNSTIAAFMEEHGTDYFQNVIAPKEKTDWVAWYTGGFDPDMAQPSDSAAAFEIAWIAEKIEGTEKWKPEL